TGGPLRQGDAELARLASLHALDVLATPAEERFDRIVALARLIFQVPMAAIALIDADRQWIKAAAGLDPGDSVPRRYSPCHYTVQQRGALVLEDTAHEARVADTTVVSRGVRFYAGQPLHAPTGERVGSLCVMDTVPRTFTAEHQQVLAQLGRLVEQELAVTGELAVAGAAQRALLSPADFDVPGYELAGRCTPARRAAGSYFDWSHEGGRVQLQVADVLGGDASGGDVAG
ncbi:GAF domain-containing protein, partial [Kocuria oceani]